MTQGKSYDRPGHADSSQVDASILGQNNGRRQPPSPDYFVLYPRRWLVLASFAVLSMSSSWIWITWSPIAIQVANYWGRNVAAVDALSAVYLYVYVPCSFVSLYLVVTYLGLYQGLLVGATFNVIGAVIRWRFLHSYPAVYVGSFICAVAQTFFLATPPLIAGSWFGATERATATALGVLANQFGTALGLGITIFVQFTANDNQTSQDDDSYNYGLVIKEEESSGAISLDEGKLRVYLGVQAGVSFLALLLVYCFGGDQPPTTPSAAASLRHAYAEANNSRGFFKRMLSERSPLLRRRLDTIREEESWQISRELRSSIFSSASSTSGPLIVSPPPSYSECLEFVFSCPSNRAFTIAYGAAAGVFYAIPTFLSQLTPKWWPAMWIGYLGAFYQLFGVLGSLAAGRLMDATQQHRQIGLMLLSLCLGALLIFTASVQHTISVSHHDHFLSWVRSVGVTLGVTSCGMLLAAWNAVGYELGTGLAYPADEAAVAGVLESSSELFGFLWVTIGGQLIQTAPGAFTMMLFCAVLFSVVLLWRLDADIKRPRH